MSDHTTSKRRQFLKSAGVAGSLGLAGCLDDLQSQGEPPEGKIRSDGEVYPDEPIEMVIWGSRGGGGDTAARSGYVRPIRENDILPVDIRPVNQTDPVVVQAMEYVNEATGGYAILNLTTNIAIWPLSHEMSLDETDFSYVARMGVEPFVMAIRTDDGRFGNAEEFRAYAQENTVNVGLSGAGSISHVIAFFLREDADLDLNFVQFTSGGPKTQALVAGDIDISIDKPSAMGAQIENDVLEPIMHFTGESIEGYEDLPDVNDILDIDLTVAQNRGIAVSPETPEDRIDYLMDAWQEIYETDEFVEYCENNGVVPAWLEGPELEQQILDIGEKFDQVFEENGLGIYS